MEIIIHILEVIVMSPLKQAFWLIVFSGIWVLGFCGMTVIGVLGKIIEWFA